MKLFAISGKATHGKDTFSLAMKNRLEKKGKRVLIIHLGDYLKFIAKAAYGWDGNKDEKGRTLLQKIGNQLREYNENILIDRLIEILDIVGDDYDYIFIPDVRFPNELRTLEYRFNTTSVYITRLIFPNGETLTDEQKNDITETSMDDVSTEFNFTFNGDNLKEVDEAAKDFVENGLLKEYRWVRL